MDRISLFRLSGLPDTFGVVVLIFSFILLLSPYLAGSDFGIFKIPAFGGSAKKGLKIFGPAVFVVAVFSFIPIFSSTNSKIGESVARNPELKALVSKSDAPKPLFFEGFSGGKLGPEWKILETDPKYWTVQSDPPSLQIITEPGSIWESAKNLKNQFILNWPLPQNFELIAKIRIQIQGVGNSVSLAVFKDDDNFMELGYAGVSYLGLRRDVHLTKEEAGKRNALYVDTPNGSVPAKDPETIYLRIERSGNDFSGAYSIVEKTPPNDIDDIRWTKIGSLSWISSDDKLSLWADNGNVNPEPPEVSARFDFVLIRELRS